MNIKLVKSRPRSTLCTYVQGTRSPAKVAAVLMNQILLFCACLVRALRQKLTEGCPLDVSSVGFSGDKF